MSQNSLIALSAFINNTIENSKVCDDLGMQILPRRISYLSAPLQK